MHSAEAWIYYVQHLSPEGHRKTVEDPPGRKRQRLKYLAPANVLRKTPDLDSAAIDNLGRMYVQIGVLCRKLRDGHLKLIWHPNIVLITEGQIRPLCRSGCRKKILAIPQALFILKNNNWKPGNFFKLLNDG